MTIALIGPGAIGGTVGFALLEKGADLIVCANRKFSTLARTGADAGEHKVLPVEVVTSPADARPAEGIRTTRAAVIMVIAIEEFCAGDREPTSQWLGLAGTTLPLLRAEAWRARRNEQEARGSK